MRKRFSALLAAVLTFVGIAAYPEAAHASTLQILWQDKEYSTSVPGYLGQSPIITFSGGHFFQYSWSGSGWGQPWQNCYVRFEAHNLSNGYVYAVSYDATYYGEGPGSNTYYINAIGTNRWQWTLEVDGNGCYAHYIAYRYI